MQNVTYKVSAVLGTMWNIIASCLFAWMLACKEIMSLVTSISSVWAYVLDIFSLRGPPPVSNRFVMHWSRVVTYEGVDCILFPVFRAAQENAERLFPDNVECKTLHSLAYEKVGSRLVHKGLTFLVFLCLPYVFAFVSYVCQCTLTPFYIKYLSLWDTVLGKLFV